MKAGGEPDIFISASKSNMDNAIENENVADGSQFDMFKNDLVIVTAESNDIDTITLEAVSYTHLRRSNSRCHIKRVHWSC